MNISINRMKAIFTKDFKEFSRNYAVSIIVLVPLVLAYFYNQAGTTTLDTIFLPLNMTFAMVTTYVQCCLIAEEKESNTLRSLMLSPATMGDILIGKSSLVFFITLIILSLSMFFLNFSPANWGLFVAAVILSAIFYLAVGVICGLFSNSVMEASVAVLPVIGVFSIGPLGILLADQYSVLKVLEYLPSSQFMLLEQATVNGITADAYQALAIISAWMVVAVMIAIVLFKKRMKDE